MNADRRNIYQLIEDFSKKYEPNKEAKKLCQILDKAKIAYEIETAHTGSTYIYVYKLKIRLSDHPSSLSGQLLHGENDIEVHNYLDGVAWLSVLHPSLSAAIFRAMPENDKSSLNKMIEDYRYNYESDLRNIKIQQERDTKTLQGLQQSRSESEEAFHLVWPKLSYDQKLWALAVGLTRPRGNDAKPAKAGFEKLHLPIKPWDDVLELARRIASSENLALIKPGRYLQQNPNPVNLQNRLSESIKFDKNRTDPIPRDNLGNPVTNGNISGYARPEGAIWYFRSVCPDDDATSDNLEELVKFAHSRGYVIREKYKYDEKHPPTPGYSSVDIWLDHPAAIAEKERLEKLAKEEESGGKKIYIRFGKLPVGGKSHDYRDNNTLSGVSCYRALQLTSGKVRLLLTKTQAAISNVSGFQGRQAYEITGKEVGTGPDGEPLLINAKLGRRVRME